MEWVEDSIGIEDMEISAITRKWTQVQMEKEE